MTAPAPTANPLVLIHNAIERAKPQIALALPKGLTPERITRAAWSLIQKTPKLQECTPRSIIAGIMQASELGLELSGVLGQAYLVPRYNSRLRCQEASFQVGFRGLIVLAFRSGLISFFNAHAVHERDAFDFEYGTRQRLYHKPAAGDRGEAIAYYAVFRTKDGSADFEVMSLAEVMRHRERYSPRGKNDSTWDTNFAEMACKTCIIRLAKRAPISVELHSAAAQDETPDSDDDGRVHEPRLGRQSLRQIETPPSNWTPEPTAAHDEPEEPAERNPGDDDPDAEAAP